MNVRTVLSIAKNLPRRPIKKTRHYTNAAKKMHERMHTYFLNVPVQYDICTSKYTSFVLNVSMNTIQ